MLKKQAVALAAGAAIMIPQIAINPAQASTCSCKKITHRRVIRHTAMRSVVYETRTIEKQPIVINNYPAAAPAAPAVIEQSAVVPRVQTFSAVAEPVAAPMPVAVPTYVRPRVGIGGIARGVIGGGVLGGGLGAATGALIGAAIGHHRAGRGALAGLGIGAGAGALFGGLGGALMHRGPAFNAGLATPWY